MYSDRFAYDLQFGSRIGQEVKVFSGKSQVFDDTLTDTFSGKVRPNFHQNIIQLAYRTDRPISVLRARDNALLFQVQPYRGDE